MAVRSRFTRIPKVSDLVQAGVPTEVIPTYCALADYSNNKNGLAWPRMESVARRLKRSPRTIQRHLHLLKELGLVEFVERTRDKRGRFGAYVYRLVHIVAATARGEALRAGDRGRGRGRKKRPATRHGRLPVTNIEHKRQEDPPISPQEKREAEARRRTEGYEWLFK